MEEHRAFPVRLPSGVRYWTVVDGAWRVHDAADGFLLHMRLGRDLAESSTKAYAISLALFFDWCAGTGQEWQRAPRALGRFVHWLRYHDPARTGPPDLSRPVRGESRARADHERAYRDWYDKRASIHSTFVAAVGLREEAERQRLAQLLAAETAYRAECQQREAEAATLNQALTKLINDLAFDVEAAIREYVGIVLWNSVYPEAFPVDHDYDFELATRELRLTVTVPPPSAVSPVKEYRYVRAKDEITSTALPVKAQKDRYSSAVTQVALRVLHEIFEADLSGKIHSIALTVGTEAISPATGLRESVPLVIVAADRETFRRFDLSNVVPRATLEHLGAAISRSPFDLVPADTSRGVRVRKQ